VIVQRGGSRRIVSSKAITVASGAGQKRREKKPSFAARILCGAGYAVVRLGLSPQREGGRADRRWARNAVARLAVGPISGEAGDQPADNAGRRAFRRSTAALFGPGRAFQRGICAALISRLSAGGP